MKKILSLILVLALCLSFAACGKQNVVDEDDTVKTPVTVNVYALKGPTGIGMVNMMKAAETDNNEIDYNFNLVGANDEIIAKISNGEADIAAVATNLGSTLYNKTSGGVSVLAINTLGVLTLVAKGEEITSIADLKGKTVYTTGQGANPEFIAKFVLENNGLKIGEDVNLEFKAQPQDLVAHVVSNEKAIVIAPQPVATAMTVKDQNAKIVLDINKEWDKFSDTALVMGCVIARNEFIKENPEAVERFLKDYKDSIEKVNSDVDTAAKLAAEYEIVTPEGVAKKAIPYCNIVFQDKKTMKTNLSAYLKFLFDNSPASMGGKLPGDDFYYEAK